MIVVTPKQMVDIEKRAYDNGSLEKAFMEDAGKGIASLATELSPSKKIILLCGKGNNGGDAYVAGVYLLDQGYSVTAYHLPSIDTCSILSQHSYHRFVAKGGSAIHITHPSTINYPDSGLIIDALFGTGFRGVAKDPYGALIKGANNSTLPILAVDIPSGLNGESGKVEGPAIIASHTAYLGLPKLGFFLNDGWNHTGKLHYVDFHLPNPPKTGSYCLNSFQRLPSLPRNRHKYQAGFVVGIAGSPGMPGAAILSLFSALRAGAGIVRILHPKGMEAEFTVCPYELIKQGYDLDHLDTLFKTVQRASAVLVGPGIGTDESAKSLLKTLFKRYTKPLVIDADALTIIAQENLIPPKNSILTPHIGEMRRLLHIDDSALNEDFLNQCQQYADANEIVLVLKGAPTFIFRKGEAILINPTGCPGMATAGSGDVLTGIIAAILCHLPPREAAASAVYLHGLAGEFAEEETYSPCMIATDIIRTLPQAFKKSGINAN